MLLPLRGEQDLRGAVPPSGHVVRHFRVALLVFRFLDERPGQAKVGYLAATVGVQKDVRRLDIN